MPSVADARRAHSPSAGTASTGGLGAAIVGVGQNFLFGSRSSDGTVPTPRPSISSPTPSASALPMFEGLDATSQLEELNVQLEKQKRIKEGAENLLNVVASIPGDAKYQQDVEKELAAATDRMTTLTRMINQIKESSDVPRTSRRGTGSSAAGSVASGKLAFFGPSVPVERARQPPVADQEDFKTAQQSAKVYLGNLLLLARQRRPSPDATNQSSQSSLANGAPAGELEFERSRVANLARLTDVLQRNMRVRYELDMEQLAQAVMPCLSDHSTKGLRASAYRLLRHTIVDAKGVAVLRDEGLDWYMIKSLARDNKFVEEKEQIVKYIRALLDIRTDDLQAEAGDTGSGFGFASNTIPISEGLMRAFIAVAEQPDDALRLASLETLAEMIMIDIDLVCLTGGLRVLMQALTDGPPDLGPALATVFMYLVDVPETRKYFRLGSDLEVAFSPFTESLGRVSTNTARMKSASSILSSMFRSWSGLLYFSLNDKRAIISLVDALRIRTVESREVLLAFFFDLLKIRPPKWHKEYLQGRRLTLYGRGSAVAQPKDAQAAEPPSSRLDLTAQFIAFLVSTFIDAGLLNTLMVIMQETGASDSVPRKAALLLDEILQIGARLLPARISSAMLSVPELFAMTMNFKDATQRNIGITSLSSIDSLDRNRVRLQPLPTKDSRNRSNSIDDAARRGQRQAEQTRKTMAAAVDDKSFQTMIVDTQVTASRDPSKWNIDLLVELMDAALTSTKRAEEVIKTGKFLRRLVPFFHPFSHRFSDLKRTKLNERYIRLGCKLLRVLMSHPEGLRFLGQEDKFISELTECFAQLDPFNGSPSSDPIFSKKRVEETLTSGYFEMLGILSQSPEGMELLEGFKIFTAFYHLSELKSREDLIKLIIEHLDYSRDGHPRIVLSKALTSNYKHIRIYATAHLGQLVQNSEEPHEWTLRLLLTQLYDPAIEVCELAVQYLDDACQSSEVLQLVVRMRPTLEHLGELGHRLLLRFMSDQAGFRYLREAQYIDKELDGWFQERNLQYVTQVEAFLARALTQESTSDEQRSEFDGIAPPHFYGEMAKTESGCDIIHEKGHFAEFAHVIRQHGLEEEDRELIMKLKSVLWAVGNIGSHSRGFQFMEEEDILQYIVDIAEQSQVLSVRGTCYFVLGLLSQTEEGAEILYDYGWEATRTPFGEPTGICLPLATSDKMERFLDIPLWDTPPRVYTGPRKLSPLATQLEQDVMLAVTNLSNTILANQASRTLAKLKHRHRRLFSSVTLFYRVLHLISTHPYRIAVRRYILDLFDVRLDTTTVAAIRKAAATLRDHQQANGLGLGPNDRRESMRLRAHARQRSVSDEEDLVSLAGSQDDEDGKDGPPKVRLEALSHIDGFQSDD